MTARECAGLIARLLWSDGRRRGCKAGETGKPEGEGFEAGAVTGEAVGPPPACLPGRGAWGVTCGGELCRPCSFRLRLRLRRGRPVRKCGAVAGGGRFGCPSAFASGQGGVRPPHSRFAVGERTDGWVSGVLCVMFIASSPSGARRLWDGGTADRAGGPRARGSGSGRMSAAGTPCPFCRRDPRLRAEFGVFCPMRLDAGGVEAAPCGAEWEKFSGFRLICGPRDA
jgi:hypothetical protein